MEIMTQPDAKALTGTVQPTHVQIAGSFLFAYTKLVRAELHLIGHILDPECKILDTVVEHNLIEEAKARVVQAYLPFNVQGSSRVDPEDDDDFGGK
jgi:hypothetical protein